MVQHADDFVKVEIETWLPDDRITAWRWLETNGYSVVYAQNVRIETHPCERWIDLFQNAGFPLHDIVED